MPESDTSRLVATSRSVKPSCLRHAGGRRRRRSRRVHDLLQADVDGAGDRGDAAHQVRGDLEVLRVAADDLHVDRRRQPEVQDLRRRCRPAGRRTRDRGSARAGSCAGGRRIRASGRDAPDSSATRISPSAAETIEASLNARLMPPPGMPMLSMHDLDLVGRDRLADHRLDLRETALRSPRCGCRRGSGRAGGTARRRRWGRSPCRAAGRCRATPPSGPQGNPESPINEGTLCPKGANTFQLAVNPHRVTQVLYRAPYSDHWETQAARLGDGPIAQRVKEARDADFTERNETGRLLNSVRNIGHARRRDARQRGELPDQEAVRRRAGRGLDREPGADMTQRLGARSGRLVRPRRGHQLPAGPGQQRLHPDHGLEHGGGPPGRLPLADEGARRRARR